MELGQKRCIPCEGGVPALDDSEVRRLLGQIDGWDAPANEGTIRKKFKFATFADTIDFVNRMAKLAEAEGHHPDFCVRFTVVDVSLTTHAIGGLSENDFILASKIDRLK